MTKHLVLAAFLAAACALALPSSVLAQQSRMKECADQWNKMKAAKQTAGKTYKDFSKDCMSQGTAATPAASPAPAPAAKPATTTASPAPKPAAAPAAPAPKPAAAPAKAGDGRAAEQARMKACGADWKTDKSANKVPAGMTWPKYWSECNTRKKAQGM
jgi:hypothetical protein